MNNLTIQVFRTVALYSVKAVLHAAQNDLMILEHVFVVEMSMSIVFRVASAQTIVCFEGKTDHKKGKSIAPCPSFNYDPSCSSNIFI